MKKFKTIVALILTLTITMMIPLQTLAGNDGKYVSEVYVAYGKNAEEAKKTLEGKGFTPVEGNLNDGGKTYSMIGYKSTNDIRDSITDLAVMNMRGDYSVEDYKNLLKNQKTQIAEFLEEFMTVIREYRANLKAGKARATYVHDLLNNYIDDDTGMKMGDLLNSETLQDRVGVNKSIEAANPESLPNLVTILMQGNTQVIKSIEVLLSMAADTDDNTWIDRFAETDYDSLLDELEDERPELNTESKRIQYLENVYGEDAAMLGIEVAELREQLLVYEAGDLHIDTSTEEDAADAFGDIENDIEAAAAYQNWFNTGAIYEGLKNYESGNFAKGELLDFFLEENDPEDTEIFIPMAASLSDGQRCGYVFVNLSKLITYAFTSDEGWKEYADKYKAGIDGLEEVSVYQNIDRGLYNDDGSVALTGAAQRAKNTADGTTGTEEEQMDTLSKITAISWAAAAGCTAATLVSFAVTYHFVKDYAYRPGLLRMNGYWDTERWNEIFSNKTYEKVMSDYRLLHHEGDTLKIKALQSTRLAVRLTRIIAIVTIAVAVFSTVMTIIDLCRDKSIEQLPIPNYLVDNYTDADGNSFSLNYKSVECNREEYFGADYKIQKGNCADLLADEGKQWLVLYASKNSKAGKPLTPDLAIQVSNRAPSGYEGCVHLFGEKGAVNVVSGAFKNYSTFSQTWQTIAGDYTMYVFTKLSDDVKTFDESAGNMTASTIGNGTITIIVFGGLAIGIALGAVITVLINKKKKKKES